MQSNTQAGIKVECRAAVKTFRRALGPAEAWTIEHRVALCGDARTTRAAGSVARKEDRQAWWPPPAAVVRQPSGARERSSPKGACE